MQNLKSIFNKLFPNRNKNSYSHSSDSNYSIDQYSKYHIKHHKKHSKSVYNHFDLDDQNSKYDKYDNSYNNDLDLNDIKNSDIIYDPLEREVRVRNKLQALIKLSEILEDKTPFDPQDSKPKINIIQWIRNDGKPPIINNNNFEDQDSSSGLGEDLDENTKLIE
jgi:hypothetical protein